MADKHAIADRKTEAIAGAALFLLGSYLIRDAYDQRGQQVPWWARPFTWW